jgi:NAD(P)H-dependent flavin oxidoreductase YrpB (nitropropane dioxygenase family)
MALLGTRVALMQAPLGRGAGAPLATAVSAAGGLGTLGASWTDPDVLREQIRAIARATDAPFCVNLVLHLIRRSGSRSRCRSGRRGSRFPGVSGPTSSPARTPAARG